MKRLFMVGGMATALVGALSTVAFARTSDSSVNLVVWTSPDTIAVQWFKTEVAKFEKLHPNIHVQVLQEGTDNNYSKYTAAIAGHQSPDLVLTYNYSIIPTWAASGLLLPMDPYLKTTGFDTSTFFPFVNRMDTFNGHTWGLVQAYDDVLLTWNKAAFKAAGLDPNKPPRTLDELWTYAKKLTKFQNGKLVQAGFIPWLEMGGDLSVWDALEGGSIYKNNKWTIDTPTMTNAMTLFTQYNQLLGGSSQWTSLIERSVGSANLVSSSNPMSPFYKGKVAMQLVGDWYPTFVYKQYAPHLQYGEAPPPVAKGVQYGTNPMIGTDVFALPKGSSHPLEATELAVFLDGKDSALLWDELESNMPPTQSAALSPDFLKLVAPEAPSVLAAKEHTVIPYPSSGLLSQVDAGANNSSILGNLAQELEYGKITPAAAATQGQSMVNQQEAMFEAEHPQWYKSH